jgi:hypothetical protein
MAEDDYPSTLPLAALAAALNLHTPVSCGFPTCRTPETHRICKECGSAINSPCSTIQVIAEALGVKDEELIEQEAVDG